MYCLLDFFGLSYQHIGIEILCPDHPPCHFGIAGHHSSVHLLCISFLLQFKPHSVGLERWTSLEFLSSHTRTPGEGASWEVPGEQNSLVPLLVGEAEEASQQVQLVQQV